MRIALSGYGKMGKIIESLGNGKHEFVLKINSENKDTYESSKLNDADVVIDFSTPQVAYQNIKTALDAGVPVVSGTTGWTDQLQEIKDFCKQQHGAFLYASNFSIGVNLFFALNKQLAQLMSLHKEYEAQIIETHHTEKLDAPSGTAITLANDLIEKHPEYNVWKNKAVVDSNELSSVSNRIENVPGTHEIKYQSTIDEIIIKHKAHSREGFAKGALLAAEWIVGKKGVFSMRDVLG